MIAIYGGIVIYDILEIQSISTEGYTFKSFTNGTGATVSVPAIKKAIAYILESNNGIEVGRIDEPNLDSSILVNVSSSDIFFYRLLYYSMSSLRYYYYKHDRFPPIRLKLGI